MPDSKKRSDNTTLQFEMILSGIHTKSFKKIKRYEKTNGGTNQVPCTRQKKSKSAGG